MTRLHLFDQNTAITNNLKLLFTMNNGVMIIYGVMIKYFISFDFLDKINAALMSIKDAFQKYYKILNIININCFNIH